MKAILFIILQIFLHKAANFGQAFFKAFKRHSHPVEVQKYWYAVVAVQIISSMYLGWRLKVPTENSRTKFSNWGILFGE